MDRIAFGGMAEIFRAKTFDKDGHAHLVAVKRILGHLAQDTDFIQMLVDEARVASLVRHRNIARVYELARVHDEYFIAMEFVDGKDTRAILDRCRKEKVAVPAQHAAYIISEIGVALHVAHAVRDGNGKTIDLVHRDVSPSNVICAYTGEVKLCDFGIAKTNMSRVKTKAGIIKGKVKYMSPEQALGKKLDHRSDIFSLGSVLYEMLTLQPPFQAPNEMELILKVRDCKIPPPRTVAPETPPALEAIAMKALSRSREARFQTGEDMAAALKGFLLSHTPTYSRSHLGRYIRKTFADDIDRELRLLEAYVLGKPTADVSVNLIADALGPRAPYKRFTPERKSGSQDLSAPITISTPMRIHHNGDEHEETWVHSAPTKIIDRKKR
jgi:eukaryotic-like serine/threonine-protein kinase